MRGCSRRQTKNASLCFQRLFPSHMAASTFPLSYCPLWMDNCGEGAEQAVTLVVRACRKEQSISGAVVGRAAAEGNCPQAMDHQRSAGAVQETAELTAPRIEGGDSAAAAIPHQNVVAEVAKVGGRLRQSPGGIEPGTMLQAHQESSINVELIHEAETFAVNLVIATALLGKANEDVAADGLNVEWAVACWKRRIHEST